MFHHHMLFANSGPPMTVPCAPVDCCPSSAPFAVCLILSGPLETSTRSSVWNLVDCVGCSVTEIYVGWTEVNKSVMFPDDTPITLVSVVAPETKSNDKFAFPNVIALKLMVASVWVELLLNVWPKFDC